MAEILQALTPVLSGFLYVLIALLCIVALLLSCLTLSGTWVVLLAAVLAILIPGKAFPGWWTIILFALVSGAVEGAEALAGAWGVRKRGGSRLSGFLAVVGGLVGLVLGTFIPIPIVGSLLGMVLCSFAIVYLVEHRRLKKADHAAHVAWGTVLGRVFVLLLKVVVTLGMIVYLWIGLV